ncbi:hypothetical protein [Sphingobium aromaticiconvertens]|uniref:hypothetical protein n=1 Tax=Sphingobium aromaticiconvertens TaxID=365341 RepID=UPI003017FE90
MKVVYSDRLEFPIGPAELEFHSVLDHMGICDDKPRGYDDAAPRGRSCSVATAPGISAGRATGIVLARRWPVIFGRASGEIGMVEFSRSGIGFNAEGVAFVGHLCPAHIILGINLCQDDSRKLLVGLREAVAVAAYLDMYRIAAIDEAAHAVILDIGKDLYRFAKAGERGDMPALMGASRKGQDHAIAVDSTHRDPLAIRAVECDHPFTIWSDGKTLTGYWANHLFLLYAARMIKPIIFMPLILVNIKWAECFVIRQSTFSWQIGLMKLKGIAPSYLNNQIPNRTRQAIWPIRPYSPNRLNIVFNIRLKAAHSPTLLDEVHGRFTNSMIEAIRTLIGNQR